MAFLRMSQGGPAGEAKVGGAKWVEDVNEGGRAQKVPFRGERWMGEFSLGIWGMPNFQSNLDNIQQGGANLWPYYI